TDDYRMAAKSIAERRPDEIPSRTGLEQAHAVLRPASTAARRADPLRSRRRGATGLTVAVGDDEQLPCGCVPGGVARSPNRWGGSRSVPRPGPGGGSDALGSNLG